MQGRLGDDQVYVLRVTSRDVLQQRHHADEHVDNAPFAQQRKQARYPCPQIIFIREMPLPVLEIEDDTIVNDVADSNEESVINLSYHSDGL